MKTAMNYNEMICGWKAFCGRRIFLLLFIAALSPTYGQMRFDQLSVSEGLSSNSVYTIFQDTYGILWFGTLDGLNRYDGHSIVVFKHDHLKKNSLSNNRVTHIYEDRMHHLWLYDEFTSTMIKYDPVHDRFKPYFLEKLIGEGLKSLDTVYEKNIGSLYIRSFDGYNLRYDSIRDAFEYLNKDTIGPLRWQRNPYWKNLIVAFRGYLSKTKSAFDEKTIEIRKILRDSGGRWWIATRFGGLFTASEGKSGLQFTSHLNTPHKGESINSAEIFDVYEDRSNVVWVGTKNSGLFRYSRYKYKFSNLSSVETSTGTFQINAIRAIAKDKKGNLWIGTNEHGLLRVNPDMQTGKVYSPRNNDPNSIGHHFIRSLWFDKQQHLWVGHYDGFSVYRNNTDNFAQYRPPGTAPEQIRVYDFAQGTDDTIWIAAWDQILRFNAKRNTYEPLARSNARDIGFTVENIRDVQTDTDGNLWLVASEKGMCIYDKATNTFRTVDYSPSAVNGLPTNNIFEVFLDSRNWIWLATSDGLCRFSPRTGTCEVVSENEGLPGNLTYGVLEDDRGELWVTTTKGIGRYNPIIKTFRNYEVRDGLLSNELTENALYRSEDGTMYFGGINGLNYFHPDTIPDNPNPPQVAITRIKAIDQPLSEEELYCETDIRRVVEAGKPVTFSQEHRSLAIEFSAYHYVNPQKNRYAYLLEGFDENWTFRDANVTFANYTNLEPGTYAFLVKACNSDGVWSKVVRLPLVIQAPFYSSTWFIAFTSVLLITISIIVYKWRISLVKKQQSLKAIQLESELNFLKSQVNPHFLFNTLNNIYALCQVNSKNAAPMVGKISEMMRYMIYDCNTPLVPLPKELDYLKNYIDLNQLKSQRKLNATMRIEGNPDNHKIAPLLLINFLENSFKHGDINQNGDGYIEAEVRILGNELIFNLRNSFRENGNKNTAQKGIGLENVEHRLALLYPGKHSLRIAKNNSIFEVELKLTME
jgi:ligand-binding sensor domain-containing protein